MPTELVEREGSGSEKVVENAELTARWLAILGSEITAGEAGHMTHIGVRRIWARLQQPEGEPGDVQLRLLWRALGSSRWDEQNPIVSTYAVGSWILVDLGECRPEVAEVGDQQWEWRLAARAPGGAGVIAVDEVFVLPTETYLKVVAQPLHDIGTPTAFSAQSSFLLESGAITGDSLAVGGTWEAEGDPDDFTIATVNGEKVARRIAVKDGVGAKRRIFASSPVLADTVVSVDIALTSDIEDSNPLRQGVVARLSEAGQNYIMAIRDTPKSVMVEAASGGEAAFPQVTVALPHRSADGQFMRLTLMVLANGAWAVWYSSASASSGLGEPLLTGWHPTLATGGSLATGKVGIHDGAPEETAATRDYRNFAAWVPDLSVICSSGRSMEVATNGVFRQSPEDDVWGRVIEDGFPPAAVPSGAEERPTRVIIIPSQGDFGELPDSGTPKVSVVRHVRAGHHFARGEQ